MIEALRTLGFTLLLLLNTLVVGLVVGLALCRNSSLSLTAIPRHYPRIFGPCTCASTPFLCGRALTEARTQLDEAQHLARLRSQLSLSEAAVLYRRARTVLSARDALCSSGDDRPIEPRTSKLVPIELRRAS